MTTAPQLPVPTPQRPTPVWIHDRLVEAGDATLAYDDHGITVGDGVFETIKFEERGVFALTQHLERLGQSARTMEIPLPEEARIRDAVSAVTQSFWAESDSSAGFLRITLTAGPGPLGTPRGELTPTLIVAVRPGTIRLEPTPVHLTAWTRNERSALAGVKSTSYGENVIALLDATRHGCSEAIFANTSGELCEGTGSNVFVAISDTLVTPPLSSGCLAGVTRQLLLDAGVGIERSIAVSELSECTEMFLVSTGREVQPVLRCDAVQFPFAPGPFTSSARATWLNDIVADPSLYS